jgi:hypothetical protein
MTTMSLHHHSDHPGPGSGDDRQKPPQSGGPQPPGFWRSKAGIVAIAFLAIAAFFLLSEHRAHALGLLPFLLILACPLLHVFMHGGHGGHDGHGESQKTESQPPRESKP